MSDFFASKTGSLLCQWNFPGKNTGVGCYFLLQGIFLTQGIESRCITHSSILACRNPWTVEPGRLHLWGCKEPDMTEWLNWCFYLILENCLSYSFAVVQSSVMSDSLWSMDCSMLGFPVLHHLPEFAQTHVQQVNDAIQPSCLLSSPSPPAFNLSQHQGLF